MVFNGTLTGNSPMVVEVFSGANEISHGLLGVFFVLLVFGIVYYKNRNEPTREAFVGASFSAMIIAVLLSVLGLLDGRFLAIAIFAFIGSLVMLINRS